MSNLRYLPKEVKEDLLTLINCDGVMGIGEYFGEPDDLGIMLGGVIVLFGKRDQFETEEARGYLDKIFTYFEENGWIGEYSYDNVIHSGLYECKDELHVMYRGFKEVSLYDARKDLSN